MSVVQPRLAPPVWLRLPRRTARLRLTGLYGGLFLLSGAALAAITYVLFERATAYRTPPLPKIPHTPAIQGVQLLGPLAQARPSLAQAQYQLSQAFHELTGASPKRLITTPSQLAQAQRQLSQAQQQLAHVVHQLARAGSVQAAQRTSDLHQLLVNSGIALAIVAVLALLAGWLVGGRMLRPIRTITRTARQISASSLHERLALDGPKDELKELGDTLDDLFERLDAAFDAQRHFVANASHELRTPLTAERTLLQIALDDPETTADEWRSTAKEVLASTDEQARLLEGLLTLASSEGRLDRREPIDLSSVVDSALLVRRPEADRLELEVDTALMPALLEGDQRLIERLVINLVDNAIGHNVVGGHVQVSTATDEGQAVLSVSNTGPVIPSTEVGRLFQPFQRLDPGRTHHKDGHGLGLSIVHAIAVAHGAVVTADREPEGGLSVSVTCPPLSLDSVAGNTPRAHRRYGRLAALLTRRTEKLSPASPASEVTTELQLPSSTRNS